MPRVRHDGREQTSLFVAPKPPRNIDVAPSGIPPLIQPMSDETGGYLNAIEAGRVVRGQSIRFGGHKTQKGLVTCPACREHWPKDSGFRMTVYSGTTKDKALGACASCGVPVVGEDPFS